MSHSYPLGKKSPLRQKVILLVSAALWAWARFAFAVPPPVLPEGKVYWKPVPDEVYLQEVGEKVATPAALTSVACLEGRLYAVQAAGLFVLEKGALRPLAGSPAKVRKIWAGGGALWALAESGVHRLLPGQEAWHAVDSRPFVSLCLHWGEVYGATRDELFRFVQTGFRSIKPEKGYLSSDSTFQMEDGTQVLADPIRIGPIQEIASYSGTLYVMGPRGIGALDGPVFVEDPMDWGSLPSAKIRAMHAQGSRLYLATDRGLGVLRGMAATGLQGKDGLPFEDLTCLAQGMDNDLWIGTSRGAIRKTEREWHFFGAQHWLPGDYVYGIATEGANIYIATSGGLGIIRYEPYTLVKKASYFEQDLEARGYKRLGFVHKLYWDAGSQSWLREISDNDGGHTAHYLAAMSFKYAVTGREQDREEARNAFQAMVWLDDITPMSGFVARAIWSVPGDKGHRSERGSGGLPAKWYSSPDGLWLWKGDTSSDEVNGHIYSVSLFYDLVAQGAEKERAREHIARIASHVIDNHWVLRDMDGKPTRWGRWDPDYLLKPYGFSARGLNGMEAQTYMQTALALTGDAKFQHGFDQLVRWGYPSFTWRQKLTFPPESVVPWDDELAFRCYYALLRYTRSPEYLSIYLRSLERSWEVMRMQHVSFFNFVYGGLTGNDCEAERAVAHLREWSLDTVNHSYTNSHRSDLAPEPGYVPYQGGTKGISPRESESMWESRSALRYDGGSGGRTVTPAVGWLEDYWMGRYHGIIEAPRTSDPRLLSVSLKGKNLPGAAPYSGPARPSAEGSGSRQAPSGK